MPDNHLFITPKPDCLSSFTKSVEVHGREYIVTGRGNVFVQTGDHLDIIYRLGPVASEVRKASGWFQ